jgi:hypothetical protein
MNKELLENTKIATYFLWEYTKCENAMELWYCAEDIAYYLERNEIHKIENIHEILKKGKSSFEYIYFIRNISFRIYLYTKNQNCAYNWYTAERLLFNGEWCDAVLKMANSFKANKGNAESLSGVHLETVRKYYT